MQGISGTSKGRENGMPAGLDRQTRFSPFSLKKQTRYSFTCSDRQVVCFGDRGHEKSQYKVRLCLSVLFGSLQGIAKRQLLCEH